jgi:hypothetical protein
LVAFPGKQIRSVKIDNDGVAHVQSLKEGRYAVWSRARTGQDAVAAFRMMDFRADSPEVALPLEATGRITGRVAAARGGLPPVDGLKVDSALTHGGELVDHLAVDLAEVMPDGRFELEGQFGVRRVSLRGLPSGWAVRELLIGRQARTQADLEVPPGATLDIVFVVERR